jgi:hypothetical protein
MEDYPMKTRRSFIKQVSAAGMLGCLPNTLFPAVESHPEKIWAGLLHLSFNFAAGIKDFGGIRTEFELSESLWRDALDRMASAGMNMVLINLEDSIQWESHPEIALKNSWSTKKFRQELDLIRKAGIEPIPMLNFSSSHDAWLGKYSRMVSTDIYYGVCRDLIAEAFLLFDKPRFFHLGMDEEGARNQHAFDHVTVRRNDLWWHDLYLLAEEVEKNGSRPWIWSDSLWSHPDQFLRKMPISILQSNWYYGEKLDKERHEVKAYLTLEAHGYDQVPTGSYHTENQGSIGNTVKFCAERIADERLLGFMQTFWKPTIEEYRNRILKGIDLAGLARKKFEKIRG